ncbi:MAG: enoyl-CoA hydratase [Proteobacteria bacterium]|nr:enoyl-CoA hydratase [Pseudomonadota bacterium]
MRDFIHLKVVCTDKIAFAQLARPEKANALNDVLWFELEQLAIWADATPEVRVLVLSGEGKHFCAGIDFSLAGALFSSISHLPEGQKQEALCGRIKELQRAFSALEHCRKPVIAAVHGSCIGGGIDLITACDMRYASENTRFSVKEVDLGIVADIGTLQRLPHLIGEGMVRELAYTGREFDALEACSMGLINRVFEDKEKLQEGVSALAKSIAEKSPLTIRGIKRTLNFSRDHSVEEGLDYVALWNSSMLLSQDTQQAISGIMSGSKPQFLD